MLMENKPVKSGLVSKLRKYLSKIVEYFKNENNQFNNNLNLKYSIDERKYDDDVLVEAYQALFEPEENLRWEIKKDMVRKMENIIYDYDTPRRPFNCWMNCIEILINNRKK